MFIRSPLKLCCTVSKAIVWRELIFRISATLGSTVPRPKQAAEETSVFSSAYLVKKAPLSWQPYLKLMRVDKPTGNNCIISFKMFKLFIACSFLTNKT